MAPCTTTWSQTLLQLSTIISSFKRDVKKKLRKRRKQAIEVGTQETDFKNNKTRISSIILLFSC